MTENERTLLIIMSEFCLAQHKKTIEFDVRTCKDCAVSFPRFNTNGKSHKACERHLAQIDNANEWAKLMDKVIKEKGEIKE